MHFGTGFQRFKGACLALAFIMTATFALNAAAAPGDYGAGKRDNHGHWIWVWKNKSLGQIDCARNAVTCQRLGIVVTDDQGDYAATPSGTGPGSLAGEASKKTLLGADSGNPNAAKTPPCDPQYMQALVAHSWLEAQREMTQVENLIFKQDSVLEVSCFNGFVEKEAANFDANSVHYPFSETDEYQQPKFFSKTSTDESLTWVVGLALAAYIDGNFPNPYLNGRLNFPSKPSGGFLAYINGFAGYSCDEMARIWEQAKCQNFNNIPGQDGFRDFLWYADINNDPRKLPTQLQSCASLTQSAVQNIYQLALNEAYNGNQALLVVPEDKDKDPDGGVYQTDTPTEAYFNLILPNTCAGAPIPTGIKYKASGGGTTDDMVCTNPGCSYDGTAQKCQ